ncbi:hypothetical protein Tco_0779805 [Tanacetum coccineum]
MSSSNQQTLVEPGATDRPLILEKGNYIPWESRPMITDPDDPDNEIPEPLSKMTEANKTRHSADVRVMNYLLQAIPNDIYNSVDACKDSQKMWERIRRLSTLMNVMDRNDTRQNKDLSDVEYDSLYDTLLQFEPHVQASKAKIAVKNHDSSGLIAHSSQSHASPSYSHSPQPYYVTHPSSVVDSDEDYQRELQRDAQEDKLTTSMMLLARAITQKLSTPTNNRLRTSSNTRNQVVIHDGWIDIQTNNDGYGGNDNKNARRQNRNQAANAGNGHYARDCPKPKVRDAKYFRKQMLLAMKDEAGDTLNDEENDFMLDNAYEDETLEELTVVVLMIAQIQPADDNA